MEFFFRISQRFVFIFVRIFISLSFSCATRYWFYPQLICIWSLTRSRCQHLKHFIITVLVDTQTIATMYVNRTIMNNRERLNYLLLTGDNRVNSIYRFNSIHQIMILILFFFFLSLKSLLCDSRLLNICKHSTLLIILWHFHFSFAYILNSLKIIALLRRSFSQLYLTSQRFHFVWLNSVFRMHVSIQNTNRSSNLLHRTCEIRVKFAVAANLVEQIKWCTIACFMQLQHVNALLRFE